MRPRTLLLLTLAAGLVAFSLAGSRKHEHTVLASAASSLTEVMKDIGTAYERAHPGSTVRFNFGSSGALQRQIEQGAPVDVFASASTREMDALQSKGLLLADTRSDFAGNRLALIVPAGSAVKTWRDLTGTPVLHVAMSDPASVPSGRYAQQTLVQRGLWQAVAPKAVYGENVRQTLSYVAQGNAEAGLVFVTDCRIEPRRTRIVALAQPGQDHPPIRYPAAALKDAPHPEAARKFALFLCSPEAQRILRQHGFEPVTPRG